VKLPNLDHFPSAIAIDLDGTLLDSQARLSARNHRALEQCLAQDIPVIIATSRPVRTFNHVFPKDVAASCSLVVMNGAIVTGNPPLSGYFKETMPKEIAQSIIDLALEFDPNIRVTIELDGFEFGANWTTDPTTLWQRNSATPDMVLPIREALLRQPCKIALGGLGTDILKLASKLINTFGNTISAIPGLLGNPILNITNPHASKPYALRKLLAPRGISLGEVIAFGDDIPDVGMLKECGISVAVANALPEVKSVCSYHTASNDEDGVALVLEEILITMKSQRE
jgi:Cof subfamily protein (haloacid dehalogenase superfamily)